MRARVVGVMVGVVVGAILGGMGSYIAGGSQVVWASIGAVVGAVITLIPLNVWEVVWEWLEVVGGWLGKLLR